MSPIAIIGGTGLEKLPLEYIQQPVSVETAFGPVSLMRARRGQEEFLFLSRHGEAHGIPPHRIPYQANIAALVAFGVTRVFAVNAVGSLRRDLPAGRLVLLDDFIDFTRTRPRSYFDGPASETDVYRHTDFTEPYCPELRRILLESAALKGTDLLPRGVYLCVEGPRYESPAEVRLFAQWGADVVGMTGLPEATLAREAGLCYAAVAVVTNLAAGLSPEIVDHGAVTKQAEECGDAVRDLLLHAVQQIPASRRCRCSG